MSNEGNQKEVIIVKQEPIEDNEQECFEYVHNTYNGNNGALEITALKQEVKIEPTNKSCTENVYMVLPQIKDEIKKEISQDNASSPPQVCEIWLDPHQEDQYYSENFKAEPEDDDSSEEIGPQDQLHDSLQEYFPDIMPHFLTAGAISEQLMAPRVVSCHKCGEVCKVENFMEHIQLKHRQKVRLTQRAPKTKRKKSVKKYVYPCPYCDKSLTALSLLKIHILTHTQEKPHKCPFCDYQGNQASHVDSHIKNQHLNIRRFKCEICDYSSNSLYCLKRHKKSHRRKKEPRQCPYCEFITFKRTSLPRHVKKFHKAIMESNTHVIKEDKNNGS